MRIVEIRLKNLNSLFGEWRIDFEDSAYDSGGVFAITGPTGAGKTTILDAVCLALYGKTPRLDSVSKSTNEIMSLRTPDCSAEVTFETGKGRYRCVWSQNRARKRADGKLQDPKREIADAETGRVLATKTGEVERTVVDVVGMDYTQFTRSMLLAQGDFDTFLKADPSDRARILERITGADLYSRISMKVHEIRSASHAKLDGLSARIAGINLLEEDDERALREELACLENEETRVNADISKCESSLAWLDGIARIEADIAAAETRRAELEALADELKLDRARLGMAARALEAIAEYTALKGKRDEQARDTAFAGELSKALPGCETAYAKASRNELGARELLESAVRERDETVRTIRRIRELDPIIRERSLRLEEERRRASDLELGLAALRENQEGDGKTLESSSAELALLREKTEESASRDDLSVTLTLMKERREQMRELRRDIDMRKTVVKDAGKKAAKLAAIWESREMELSRRQLNFESRRAELGEREQRLAVTIQGRTVQEWRAAHADALSRRSVSERALAAAVLLEESALVSDEQKMTIASLSDEITALGPSLNDAEALLTALEHEVKDIREEQARRAVFRNFEDARRLLKKGEPCPLCGATEHPFEGVSLSASRDDAEERLNRLTRKIKDTQNTISAIKIREAETKKDLSQAQRRLDEALQKRDAANAELLEHREILKLDSDSGSAAVAAAELSRSLDEKIDRISAVVKQADALETEIKNIAKSIESSRDALDLAKREALRAENEERSNGDLLSRAKEELASLMEEVSKKLDQIRDMLSPYNIAEVSRLSMDAPNSIAGLDRVIAILSGRLDESIANMKRADKLARIIEAISAGMKSRDGEMKRDETALAAQRERLDGIQAEYDSLSRQRFDIFGDRDPDGEEHRLAELVSASEARLESAKGRANASAAALDKLLERIGEMTESVASRSGDLASAGAAFERRISSLGFKGEAEYLSAILPEEERALLKSRVDELDESMAAVLLMEGEKRKVLSLELGKRVTEASREDIGLQLNRLLEKKKTIHIETGSISQRLRDNDSNRAAYMENSVSFERQRDEYERWDALHRLIGSSDGKKYRDFVQGLTFEIMTDYANAELTRMTDRYLLTGSSGDDAGGRTLELRVTDNYQAGEQRSAKNLSGGESFLVSMALALGLSRLASNNIRVDSLFLDEGFGSLDDDTLETVLDTLSAMHQRGKLIGIISHVGALTERIATQIRVVPRTGGRSAIQGPGCSEIARE
ncbi:MAG: AAA family ATPase [Synergistaceae bacterium]|jgi:exonuclease SbcC|nr:AAA family ATPase [Synergistaceae bacterium]